MSANPTENLDIKQSEDSLSNVESSVDPETPIVESEEPASKKARKPFVFTEKRKEAFERCRQRREERAKEKRASAAEMAEVRKILSIMKADKSAPPLFSTQPIPASMENRSTQDLTDSVPRAASNLTMTSTPINLPQHLQLRSQTLAQKAPEVLPLPKLETAATPLTSPALTPPVSTLETQQSSSSMATTTSSHEVSPFSVAEVPIAEVDFSKSSCQKSSYGQDTEINERKRKVQFDMNEEYIEGVGAGNHPPFYEGANETQHMAIDHEESPYYRVKDTDSLDDDTLYALLMEARRRKETSSVYQMRRDSGKMQRPTQASLFLDSVGGNMSHPSQLFSSHLIHSAKPKASAPSNFTWL
jgi:hypothetical protein